jgi:hypothetical protein
LRKAKVEQGRKTDKQGRREDKSRKGNNQAKQIKGIK